MEHLDGWDALLIAIALVIVGSLAKDIIKMIMKKKRQRLIDDFTYDVTVWLPNDVCIEHVGAVDVEIKDNYVCMEFEDESEIEYEGVTLRVVSKPVK